MTTMKDNRYRRWYDDDPTMSLVISLLKNAPESVRKACAMLILDKAKEFGVLTDKSGFDKIIYQFRRWYDKEKNLFEAIECLRISPVNERKKITSLVIEYLQTITTTT